MRILHLITGLGGGGAERQLCLLAEGLGREGVSQMIVTLIPGGAFRRQLEQEGIETVDLGAARGAVSPGTAWKLRGIVARYRPDVLHGWMYHANLAATLVASAGTARPALVWGIRSSLEALHTYRRLTRYVIRATRWLSARPARIVYNSEASARQHADAGFESRGARVIANGIDMRRFAPQPGGRESVRAGMGLRDDELVIGNAARFDPSKDHPALLRAFAQLSAVIPAARLVLCGNQVDDANPSLVALLAELGIRERVILLGERTDVPEVMRAWDLGLNASVREGFPNMIAECMACGVPCVATGAGDTRTIVGDAGYVTEVGNAAGLQQALLRAAQLPASERVALGHAARARIERVFSAGRMIQEYLELYAGIPKPTHAALAKRGN